MTKRGTSVRIRNRKRLNCKIEDLWEPQWNEAVKGWTRKFILNNMWRTETMNDMEDLMQDAYIVFMKVRDSYPQVVEAPLFMKMYQTALWRKFMDKGRKLKNDILAERGMLQEVQAIMPHMKEYNEGPLLAMLASGPPEVQLLMKFIQDDNNLLLLREPQRKRWSEPRQNIDQRLSSLLGIPTFPFREFLHNLLFA